MRGATSPRLLLELMCAQVLLPAAASDERSVLARLERLEAGAAAAGRGQAGRAAPASEYPERMPACSAPRRLPRHSGAAAQRPPQSPASQAAGPAAQPAQPPAAQPQPPASGSRPAAQPAARSRVAAAGPPASAPAPAFTHAPGAAGAPAAAAEPRGSVTVDVLRQAWPRVVEAIKAKGRVAAIVIGNASVASFDEGVLTLRFPRQGDVKGFQGSKYEDLLKQAIATMFGINVVIRAVTGGGDAPSPAAARSAARAGSAAPTVSSLRLWPPSRPPSPASRHRAAAGRPAARLPAFRRGFDGLADTRGRVDARAVIP